MTTENHSILKNVLERELTRLRDELKSIAPWENDHKKKIIKSEIEVILEHLYGKHTSMNTSRVG